MSKKIGSLIFQPTYVFPSSDVDGGDVIDAASDNIFSAKINSLVAIGAYQVVIYKNDEDSTQVYDSGVIASSTSLTTLPFYPYTYDGTEVFLKYTVPANSIYNGQEYKWVLNLWSSYSSSSPQDNCITSLEYVFSAKALPTVAIADFTSPVASISNDWTATYTGDSVMWFRWVLTSNGSVVDDTGELYITSELKYSYNALTNGAGYTIQCIVRGQDGRTVESVPKTFTVSYDTIDTTAKAAATMRSDGGVMIDWGSLKDIVGTSTPTPSYVPDYPSEGMTALDNTGSVTFTGSGDFEVSADNEAKHVVSVFPRGNGTVYQYEDAEKIIKIYISDYTSPLEPSTSLEPSETLVPSAGSCVLTADYITISGTWRCSIDIGYIGLMNVIAFMDGSDAWNLNVILNADGNVIRYEDVAPTAQSVGGSVGTDPKIILSGDGLYSYVWITNDEDISLTNGFEEEPSWTFGTTFLALFDNNLVAGNALWGTGDSIDRWGIWRTNIDTGITEVIATVSGDVKNVIDYSACGEARYQYTVMAISEEDVSTPLLSNEITTELCKFILMVCDATDVKNQYVVDTIVDFEYDIGDVSYSNNTTINKLSGYGKYYRVQHSSMNAVSVTLSSYLGVVGDDGEYRDDVTMYDVVMALSTDDRRKYLKDTRGHIWRVQVSSPVTMTQMNIERLPYKKQLEVVQVGDATKDCVIGW